MEQNKFITSQKKIVRFPNTITDIAINHQTGEVYIGTSKGYFLICRMQHKGIKHIKIQIFTPIRCDQFNGTIAIKGLVEDADVKIATSTER